MNVLADRHCISSRNPPWDGYEELRGHRYAAAALRRNHDPLLDLSGGVHCSEGTCKCLWDSRLMWLRLGGERLSYARVAARTTPPEGRHS